jgi:probable selenium-dependent hydroxylase accessory protein YqeC
MKPNLLDLFHARTGTVCIVGAGGKKTTLYRLASAHPGNVAITSTVLTPPFRKRLGAHSVVEPTERLTAAVAKAAHEHRRVAYATPSDKPARLGGVPPQQIAEIHSKAGFQLTLVKGDGARLRWWKAPSKDEPVIPVSTSVIPVVSARVIGEPLSSQITHRLDEVVRVTGAKRGERITPQHVARLLASERGSLKNVGEARVIAVINMVETPAQIQLAREAAQQALALTDRIEQIVLAKMIAEDPVVEVVTQL